MDFRFSTRSAIRSSLLITAIAGTAAPFGCASKPSARTQQQSEALAPVDPAFADRPKAIQELHRAPARPAPQPAASVPLKPPPGIDANRLIPIPPAEVAANPKVSQPLEEVARDLATKVSLPKAAQTDVDESAKEEAVRLYVSGRSALLAGDYAQAQSLLTDAAGKDPSEPAVWRELGEAQLRLGRKALAASSFSQAARRGMDDARVWWMLGRDAAQRSDPAKAASYFAKARLAPDLSNDSALVFIVETELGQSLAQLGYLRAASEALSSVADLPSSFSENTIYRNELGEVYRRRGELLEESGDILMRTGDTAGALERYELASTLPSLDPGSSLVRLIYAAALRGEPEKGAEALIESIIESDGWIEDRQLLLIRYLSDNTSVGPSLARSIRALPGDLKSPPTPSIESRLVRAQAASDPDGAAILRTYLKDHPGDADAQADLLSLVSSSGGSEAREVLALSDASPRSAVRLAEAVMSEGRNLQACRTEIDRGAKSPGQRATAAWLSFREGFTERAHKLAVPIDIASGNVHDQAVLLGVQLRVALETGDIAWARELVATLKNRSDLPFSVRASSLLDGGEGAFVADMAKQLNLAEIGDDTDERIGVAEIIARAGRAKEAETLLRGALAKDRFNERAYQVLLALYMPGAPLQDDSKLSDLSRQLRETIPSSRVIRWLAAAELAQRQLWPQVEAALISLSEEAPPDPGMIELLVSSWERQAAGESEAKAATLNRAEAWLRAKLAEYPDSIYLGAALARITELQGRPGEAETALAAMYERFPVAAIARQREQVIRNALKDPARARSMALKRLDRMPRPVDDTLELAELYAADGSSAQVSKALLDGIPPDCPLNGPQRERLVGIVNQQVAVALKDESGNASGPALANVARALEAGIDFPRATHEARLLLMAGAAPLDLDQLVAASKLEAGLFPDGSTLVIVRTADRISKSPSASLSPRYLRACIPFISQPTTEIFQYLVFLTGKYGTVEDVRAFATLIEDPSRAEFAKDLAAIAAGAGEDIPATQKARVTQSVYLIGNAATLQNRPDFAEEIYRFVLEREPDHAMAGNNLAYHLIETGRDLAEAERLLEASYATQPETSSILDSLGWLRYKQGQFSDIKDASGNVTKPGAISLLTRATEARDAFDNAVITDHLGDALWAAGEREKARDCWQRARASAKKVVDEISARQAARAQGEDPETYKAQITEFRAVLNGTEQKLKAVETGQEPPVAPRAPRP